MDAYRHAIAEYGPEAKQKSIATVFRSIIEDRRRKLRESPEAYSQTVTFVVPGMIKGSGGHNKIMSLVKWLAHFGYTVMVAFTEPTEQYPTPEPIAEQFGFDSRYIRVVYCDRLPANSNITFATYWKTVYNIDKSSCLPGRKYHFLQDYEPYFFAMGTDYLLAINAMQRDFHKISYGPWIKRLIAERHKLQSDEVPFYIDKGLYKPDSSTVRRGNRILYFARPEMPRRCFGLGIEALTAYQTKYGGEAEIVMFGSFAVEGIGLPLRFIDLKVLPPHELAQLYSEATLGVVFSPTNPSMVPFEMMACGLPVMDIDVEGNSTNYGGRDNVFLVAPDPDEIAERIHQILENTDLRERVARNGKAFAEGMSDEGRAIRALVEIIDPTNTNHLRAS